MEDIDDNKYSVEDYDAKRRATTTERMKSRQFLSKRSLESPSKIRAFLS